MDAEPTTQPRENLRRHYRVEYPARDRPAFRAATWQGSIIDVSESGMRVRITQWPGPDEVLATGATVGGAILFKESGPTMVRGLIVRFDGDVLAVRLDDVGVPYATILREQRWLRARHPWGY